MSRNETLIEHVSDSLYECMQGEAEERGLCMPKDPEIGKDWFNEGVLAVFEHIGKWQEYITVEDIVKELREYIVRQHKSGRDYKKAYK